MGQQNDDLWMGPATGPQTAGWANAGNPGVIGRGVGPLGRTYVFDIVPAASTSTAIAAAQAISAAGNALINGTLASGGVATLDYARGVSLVTSNAGNTTQTVTLTGTDYYGQTQTQTVTLNGITAVVTTKTFKTITQIAVSAALTGNLSVGTADLFGLPYAVTNAGYLLRTGWDNVVSDNAGTFVAADTTSPATATTGDVRGTYAQSGNAANGSRRLVIALGLTAIQAGPNATQVGAIGVVPA